MCAQSGRKVAPDGHEFLSGYDEQLQAALSEAALALGADGVRMRYDETIADRIIAIRAERDALVIRVAELQEENDALSEELGRLGH